MGLGEKPVLGRKRLVWGVMRCRACRYMREKPSQFLTTQSMVTQFVYGGFMSHSSKMF